jgi:hypothetical protein
VDRQFRHIKEPSFVEDLRRSNLTGPNFAYFFAKVEDSLDTNPWFYGTEVPGGDGLLMIPTADAFPDIPASYVFFKTDVASNPSEIRYYGLSPVWSEDDLPDEVF